MTPPVGWSKSDDGSESLVFTPPVNGGSVGPGSALTLCVGHFTANQVPGQVTLHLGEQSADAEDTQTPQKELELLETEPGLSIDRFVATPSSVSPGGSTTLDGKGAQGATYVIKYGDHEIDHVKGQPGTPLPATGSYTIDTIVEGTTFTLVATKSGFPEPVHAQTTVSVVEAEIVTFATEPEKPLIGQPVTLTWTASGASVTLEPGGHVFPTKSGTGQTGTFTMTPTAEKTKFTLTASQGATRDERQLSVKVQEPQVSMGPDPAPTLLPNETTSLNWTVSNVAQTQITTTVTGQLSGKVYHENTNLTESGTTHSDSFTLFETFPLAANIAGGEPVVQAITVQVLPGMTPMSQSRVIPYGAPHNLQTKIGLVVPDLRATAKQLGTSGYWAIQFTGTIEHATTLEVTQTSQMMMWWGYNAGQAATEITSNSCAFALDHARGRRRSISRSSSTANSSRLWRCSIY